MVNSDKNADLHVMDQNVNRISREIAYIPLGERIKSKRSSYMQHFSFIFFLFFIIIFLIFLEKNEYKTCLPVVTTK